MEMPAQNKKKSVKKFKFVPAQKKFINKFRDPPKPKAKKG